MSKTNTILTNIIRAGFLGWICFETLNWVGILHFSLAFTWFGLVFTMSVVWSLVEFMSWRVKKTTGEPLPWFVFLAVLTSGSFDAMGDIKHWYVIYSWYDQAAHVLGGGMTALLIFYILWRSRNAGRMFMGKYMAGLMTVGFTMALGSCYELEEYLEDVFRGAVGVRLGDGVDTANDMLMNTIGALIVVILLMFFIRKVAQWKTVREEGPTVVSSDTK
ncbi:MAG: hypothetical protein WCT27_05380 [Patescibacteria group bacterium]